jgi:hypothetical protein
MLFVFFLNFFQIFFVDIYKHMINSLRFIQKLCNKHFKYLFLKKQNNLISECYWLQLNEYSV